ncbi:MAG: hypothetical protein HFG33_01695 [Bacilli bacterium]|nr:hypothetical protein [Bacilli bacterium]
MRKTVLSMIRVFGIREYGFDMMGYLIDDIKEISYHHLLVSSKDGGSASFNNGALLNRFTAHDYLHVIERFEPRMFLAITEEMAKENEARQIRIDCLIRIRDILLEFEELHRDTRIKNGRKLIKDPYIIRRVPL